ncbi:MAG: hypothetical protein AB1641_29845 [Thermodesulfobacteriota bacterium]
MGLFKNRGGHWLWASVRRVWAYLGPDYLGRLLEGFDRLLTLGQIAVSRSI